MNRRHFLKNTAATLGTLAFPTIVPSTVFGKQAPSKRVHLGCIGVGGQGTGLMNNALYNKQAQVVAVCDCFASRRQKALDKIKTVYTEQGRAAEAKATAYADFREMLAREDIDGVIIATPDHWHVPLSIYAVQAGKDVYVEKPLGTSMEDGFKLRKLVQDKKAILQYGTQQRSSYYFRFTCELVRNGYIGELERIDAWCAHIGNGALTKTMPPTQPVPADIDYDRWIGPAPMKPYCEQRVTRYGAWHIYDYALGFIAGWGAHPLDIAQWGNNTDNTAPIHYEGTGTLPTGGLYDSVSFWDMHCTYANGVKMHFMDRDTARPIVNAYHPQHKDHGTTFHGSEGWVSVRRGMINFSDEKLRRIKLKPNEVYLYESSSQVGNFIDCIQSRKQPISTIEAAVQSDLISHLSNAVVRLDQSIDWDPQTETIKTNAAQVKEIINRSERSPWTV